MNYYNEWDKYAAAWLRNLIAAGHLPDGEVDERSITDVSPDDLAGFRQCHFFAGIGGWSLAARLAGWPEDRELWTGSPPCQPFSVAGKQRGQDDERHLWPHYFRLIAARRPLVVMGEQVAAAVGKDWFDGVRLDLSTQGYACDGAVIPACAVNAPHRRDRLWFVAELGGGAVDHSFGPGLEGLSWHDDDETGRTQQNRSIAAAGGAGSGSDVADATNSGGEARERDALGVEHDARGNRFFTTSTGSWIIGNDGKARRVEPGICLLAHGVPARVGKLRAYGNAIVPQVAAEVIGAYLECRP